MKAHIAPSSLVPATFVLLALMSLVGSASAQTRSCDALRGAQRVLAQAILSSQRAYQCCDDTLAKCLRRKQVCGLVTRLVEDVCQRAAAGKNRTEIEKELERRASSATGPKHVIDLNEVPWAGEASAPVTIVAYACARCPLCARTVPLLHETVTRGHLKGKAKLYVKAFPIRTHQHSTIAATAWMAGQQLGHFWELLLAMYADFDNFAPSRLPDYAQGQGMDRERFRALLGDSAVREKLTQSKKEGVRNRVDSTPAIFVDGRRYLASLDLPTLEDFVEERIEQGARR